MTPPPSVVLPALQSSGTGAPRVEEFMAALEVQLRITGRKFNRDELASRLTGRALLWYATTYQSPPTPYAPSHYDLKPILFINCRRRLLTEFSFQQRTPIRRSRALTQGADTVAEYARKYQTLASNAGENVSTEYNRLWWAYGLQPQLCDVAFDLMIEYPAFVKLADAVHAAELKIAGKASFHVKAESA